MEKIIIRYNTALKTLISLKESLDMLHENLSEDDYLMLRDCVLHRFKSSVYTFVNLLKVYLEERLHVTLESTSPRNILFHALKAHILPAQEHTVITEAIIWGNKTSEGYIEEVAKAIMDEIPISYETMHTIIKRIKIS